VLLVPMMMTLMKTTTASASAPDDVSEIAPYWRIYDLSIPNNASFDVNPVPYSVDASDTAFPSGISRIAYYLELDDGTGRRWIWVSMNAFTQDLRKIGVPTKASGAVWQQTVAAMNVESNVPGVVTGVGIATGNIEFWPYNYGRTAALPGIGGSSALYDFNDLNELGNNYGSMQVHNYGAAQTLLAYNDWGGNPTYDVDDVGIGNNPAVGGNPDWTFQRNASSYTLKRLEVWVLPTPTVPALGPIGAGALTLLLGALGLHSAATAQRR
jgi:sialate O-acetylesterase